MMESEKIPFSMPFNWDKYIGECSRFGLTPEQQGAYMKLICTFWGNRCKPLVDDPEKMARITGFTVDRWTRKIRPGLIDLFVTSDDGWAHEWIGEEWDKTVQKIAVKSANGKQGGRGHSKKPEREIENLQQEISPEISKSQTANPLINIQMEKATGYAEVKLNESTYTYNQSKKEESKKDPPLKPPHGGQANGVLFPAQEVQYAPPKPKKPRRGKSEPPPVPEEIFQAFWSLNPPPDEPNKFRHNEKATRHNMAKTIESGVDPQELIQAWSNYRDKKRHGGKFYTEYIMAAQNFVSLREREWEKHLAPFVPPKHNGNVTPMRASNNGQVPKEYIKRAGVRVV
jgi:uncharacterized protein YdaU (DUF1376 family)